MNARAAMGLTLLTWALPGHLLAADADALAEIRQQMITMQQEYEARIQALEVRVTRAEALARDNADAVRAAPPPAAAAGYAAVASSSSANRAFNPALSVILQGSANAYSDSPDDYALPGFQLGEEGGLANEGLTLDETELTASANIDPYFYGQMTMSLVDEGGGTEVELEEAFIEPQQLPAGLNARAGRFFSDVGYLNRFHSHAWDFRDAPLAYRAFLGKQYTDDGLRLAWVAPTDTYLLFGAETYAGNAFPGGSSSRTLGDVQTVYLKLGGDVGASHAWQAGLAGLFANANDRETDVPRNATDRFNGDSDLLIADLVWKWAPNGNATQRNFKFQTEFFYRDESGQLTVEQDDASALLDYDGDQWGWYAQGIYQFVRRWRAGLRYDRLDADNDLNVLSLDGFASDAEAIAASGLDNGGHEPERWTAMLDWSPSEFSRVRLQYTRDESRVDQTDHQWFVQYLMSLGAHGAHEF